MEPETSDSGARLRKAGRIVLVFGMLAGAVIGGIYLGRFLLATLVTQGLLARAATALGVAAILAMVKEGLSLLPGIVSYLKTGEGEGLYRLCGFVLVAAATATVSVPTLTGKTPPPSAPAVAPADSHVLFLSRRGETTFVLPFFEEANLCSPLGECDDGLTLDDSTTRFVAELVNGLVECGSQRRPVAVEVRGFASSSKFEGRDDSDELNVETANLRAEAVVQAIWRRLEAMEDPRRARARIDLRTVRWSSFDSMARAAGYKDHDDEGEYSELRGLLNRRAELILVDPAGCEVSG